ncbi:Substrate-binding domain transporter protein [Rickettsiales endosymbiont of Paramecium tredecaurelia]|uniref:transporter substrate-binding domain-containing protein n=1 Tax=Candidatus Sarmatiella mevalonica TaxID=2770581 RepID=UPI001920ED33|nr:transporter substrate-binding domain-containing protein [Candidatus Sarmatiella mevalonica]MBL3284315.1 Substrate-binding domain transporter protein [Candidatus Sarmatiella mevalonica]
MDPKYIIYFIVFLLYVNLTYAKVGENIAHDHYLVAGWNDEPPYQMLDVTRKSVGLTGLDIELLNCLFKANKIEIKYQKNDWHQQQIDLQNGIQDVAMDVTKTESREGFVSFSVPYRIEENSLFILKQQNKLSNFHNIPELLSQLRLYNTRVGVIKGNVFSSNELNLFINHEFNQDIVFHYSNYDALIKDLKEHIIECCFGDRLIIADFIFNNALENEVQEIFVNLKTPVHLALSKTSVSPELTQKINQGIIDLIDSREYQNILKRYLYPLLLLQVINSDLFSYLAIAATISFAFSAMLISIEFRIGLMNTIYLALIPSLCGGVMRDVIIDRRPVGIILNPVYIYLSCCAVLAGLVVAKFIKMHNINLDLYLPRIQMARAYCDVFAKSSFIAIGVAMTVMSRIEPLELWGPFFALLTCSGGALIRNLLLKTFVVGCEIRSEGSWVYLFWSAVLSGFISFVSNQNKEYLELAVYITSCACLCTAIAMLKLKTKDLKFY